jgi:hypothetical protein
VVHREQAVTFVALALAAINDSGILLAIDPATGAVLKQGRLKGAIDKYFASLVGADGKVLLVSQDGTASIVGAKARLGHPVRESTGR